MKSMMKKIYFFLSFFIKNLTQAKRRYNENKVLCTDASPCFLLSEEGIKNGAARVLFLRIL